MECVFGYCWTGFVWVGWIQTTELCLAWRTIKLVKNKFPMVNDPNKPFQLELPAVSWQLTLLHRRRNASGLFQQGGNINNALMLKKQAVSLQSFWIHSVKVRVRCRHWLHQAVFSFSPYERCSEISRLFPKLKFFFTTTWSYFSPQFLCNITTDVIRGTSALYWDTRVHVHVVCCWCVCRSVLQRACFTIDLVREEEAWSRSYCFRLVVKWN